MSASVRLAIGCVAGFVTVALLVSLGITAPWDSAGLLEVARFRTPAWTSVMQGITSIGGGEVLAPIALLFGAWLWVGRSRREAGRYLATLLLGWGFHAALKWAFARPRPSVVERLDGAGWYSFPSGHAMMSAMILGLTVLLLTERKVVRGAVGLLVALIAFSRVYLGVHYPSDVIAGVLGGAAWVAASVALVRGGIDRAPPVSGSGTLPAGQTSGSGGGR